MADKIFLDIISGHISLDNIQDWLAGKDIQAIDDSLSRTDFVSVVLKCIQEETNKFLPTPSTSSTQQSLKDGLLLEQQVPAKRSYDNESKKSEDELSNQRTPFQAVNKATSTKTVTHQFSRHTNSGLELRKDTHGSTAFDGRNILTSTPVRPRRNSSRNDQFTLSPPGSFHSDQSSHSQTPRSSKSSRFNSSSGLHHFSPNSSQSPPFSPSSPQYTDSFPDLGAKSRQRTPQSPCLGDFIKTKPASQKTRKRIKPTQLTTPEKDASTECSKGNTNFGIASRPFVPITATQTEVKEQLNFDEERNLLKQKRIQILKSSQDNPQTINPDTANSQFEEKQNTSRQNNSICISISKETSEPNSNISSSPQSVKFVTVDPDPNLVKNIDKILRLASIYSACLDANLVPNITSELYNVFNLLTAVYKSKVSESANSSKQSLSSNQTNELSSGSGSCKNLLQKLCLKEESQQTPSVSIGDEEMILPGYNNTKVFTSVHDCVMFSVCVLKRQINTLLCIDKSTLRLLIENTRLSAFLPDLVPHLVQIMETKEAQEACYNSSKPSSFLTENGPVLYHIETDNQDNFSTKENFNFFKKQRDGFYETLHEWRTKNSDNVWTSRRFPQRVQQLLSLSSDPVNMMHLARLFCAQMTNSKSEPQEEPELAGVSKDKLCRLQARFSKPAEGGVSPRPPPTFPAEQQFYQQFLQLAVGSTFLHHVTDCLVYRLCHLDHADLLTEGLAEEESKSHVQAWVRSSCLIAKILGFVTFLPYKSNTPLAPDVLQAQIMVREQVVPPVNLLPLLHKALTTNRLVVTVPWVVAYLGMMDPVVPYLASYRPLLQLLVSVYKVLPLPYLSSMSNFFLRCLLGWLFDTSSFPQHVFSSLMSNTQNVDFEGGESLDVVDQALLYEVCPYLNCLRQLQVSSSGPRQGSVRHITPVSTQLPPSTASSQASQQQTLEMQLEECFLNGQSTSFRSTVEMIVDRVSSCCIKHICSHVIAPAKDKFSQAINQRKEEFKSTSKKQMEVWISDQCQLTAVEVEAAVTDHCEVKVGSVLGLLLGPDLIGPDIVYLVCLCQMEVWISDQCQLTAVEVEAAVTDHCEVKVGSVLSLLLGPDLIGPDIVYLVCLCQMEVWISDQCQLTAVEVEAAVTDHCEVKVGSVLGLLLGPDLTDPTLCRTTHAICARRCRERIVNWLNSHIKLTDVFSKLIPTPEGKQTTDLIKPSKGRETVEHRDSAVAPADMIIELQDKLCECIERRSSDMSEGQVIALVNRVQDTVRYRSDLIAAAEQTIFSLTVDLCIVLLAYAPWTMTSAVISQLCGLWSVCSTQGSSQLERVMSARNTLLLCQRGAQFARESWEQLSLVLVELLKHSPPLLTPSQLETQCVALFRLDWPPMVLTLMGACLSSMLEKIKRDPIHKHKPKFVLMLEWVNEMTEDLARPDIIQD
ncbi:protein disks lost [Macrosteles quadrilineatus]|uniref:protein disks lost n=1 Tax=Macrosteles quadrilineatus TaxID=74068 RepID=UPI0023E211FD|nr:protein disks lost [Macrosteles quadrilineatus]